MAFIVGGVYYDVVEEYFDKVKSFENFFHTSLKECWCVGWSEACYSIAPKFTCCHEREIVSMFGFYGDVEKSLSEIEAAEYF